MAISALPIYASICVLLITHGRQPDGQAMDVFHDILVWPKFYLRIWCAVCGIVLYGTAIYRVSMIYRYKVPLGHNGLLIKRNRKLRHHQPWRRHSLSKYHYIRWLNRNRLKIKHIETEWYTYVSVDHHCFICYNYLNHLLLIFVWIIVNKFQFILNPNTIIFIDVYNIAAILSRPHCAKSIDVEKPPYSFVLACSVVDTTLNSQ